MKHRRAKENSSLEADSKNKEQRQKQKSTEREDKKLLFEVFLFVALFEIELEDEQQATEAN